MAQIKKTDIIQEGLFSDEIENAKKLSKALDEVDSAFVKIAKDSKDAFSGLDLKNVKDLDKFLTLQNELNDSFEENVKVTKKKKELDKDIIKIQQEEEKLKQQQLKTDILLRKEEERLNKQKSKNKDLTRQELVEREKLKKTKREELQQAKAIATIQTSEKNSIEALRAELSLVTIEWKKLTQEELENTTRGQRLVQSKLRLTEALKKEEKATGDARRNVGNYEDSVKKAILSLNKQSKEIIENITALKRQQNAVKRGSAEWHEYERRIQEADKELQGINVRLGQSGQSTSRFGGFVDRLGEKLNKVNETSKGGGLVGRLAGGAGRAVPFVAAAAGIFKVAQGAAKVTEEFQKIRGELQRLLDLTDDELDRATVNVAALSKTFGEEQQELIKSANVLIKTFGISQEEAFQLIEDGFLSAANAQGDLLDSIKEYSVQAEAAGISAGGLISILDESGKQGIFSDKGIDTVKEFGLRIREQTKATKLALQDAFGSQFTKQLFDGINDGSLTTVDALKAVSKQLNRTDIDVSKVQTVIADVFGGAGEDAGLEFIKTLKDVNNTTDGIVDTTIELNEHQKEQIRLEKEIAEAKNELSKVFVGNTEAANKFREVVVFLIEQLTISAENIMEIFGDVFDLFGKIKEEIDGGLSVWEQLENTFRRIARVATRLIPFGLGKKFQELIGLNKELDNQISEQAKSRQAVIKLQERALDLAGEETRRVKGLISFLKADNTTREDKEKIIKKLNVEYGDLIENTGLEIEALEDLDKIQNIIIENIARLTIERIKAEKQQEIATRLFEAEARRIAAVAKNDEEARLRARIDIAKARVELINLGKTASTVGETLADALSVASTVEINFIRDQIAAIDRSLRTLTGQEYEDRYEGLMNRREQLQRDLDAKLRSLLGDSAQNEIDTDTNVVNTKIRNHERYVSRKIELEKEYSEIIKQLEKDIIENQKELQKENNERRIEDLQKLIEEETKLQVENAENGATVSLEALEKLLEEERLLKEENNRLEREQKLQSIDEDLQIELDKLKKNREARLDDLFKRAKQEELTEQELKAEIKKIDKDYDDSLIKIEQDRKVRKERIKQEEIQSNEDAENAKLDKVLEVNQQILDAEKKRSEKQQQITTEEADKEKEAQEKRIEARKQTIETLDALADAFIEREQERLDKQLENIDKEIDASKRRVDELKRSSNTNRQTIDSNIAFEEAKQAQLEKQRLDAEKKQRQIELATTAVEVYSNKVANNDPNPLLNTIKDITLLQQFVKNIPLFWEGTDTTVGAALGTPHLNTARDGYIVRVDKDEKILNPYLSAMTGNMTTEEIAQAAYDKRMGIAQYTNPFDLSNQSISVANVVNNNSMYLLQQEMFKYRQEQQETNDKLQELINKPTSSIFYNDEGAIPKIVQKTIEGNKITTRNKFLR